MPAVLIREKLCLACRKIFKDTDVCPTCNAKLEDPKTYPRVYEEVSYSMRFSLLQP